VRVFGPSRLHRSGRERRCDPHTLEVSISQQVPGPFPLPDRVSNSLRTYDAGAALGAEVRWRVTAHATLAPGLRVVTLPDGWVVRPLLAAGWTF
jgi:hypothetical protein